MRPLLLVLAALILAVLFTVGRHTFDAEAPESPSKPPVTVSWPDLPAPPVFTVQTTSTTAAPTTTTHTHPVARSAPKPRVTVRAMSVPSGAVTDIIRATFARFGPGIAEQAIRVAQCESRLNPGATNGQHAGLFQISRTYHSARVARLGYQWSDMFSAGPNAAVAASIYGESRWRPWTCQP